MIYFIDQSRTTLFLTIRILNTPKCFFFFFANSEDQDEIPKYVMVSATKSTTCWYQLVFIATLCA